MWKCSPITFSVRFWSGATNCLHTCGHSAATSRGIRGADVPEEAVGTFLCGESFWVFLNIIKTWINIWSVSAVESDEFKRRFTLMWSYQVGGNSFRAIWLASRYVGVSLYHHRGYKYQPSFQPEHTTQPQLQASVSCWVSTTDTETRHKKNDLTLIFRFIWRSLILFSSLGNTHTSLHEM